MLGGPSSLTIVPIAKHVPGAVSLEQNAPPATLVSVTKICSSDSMTVSAQIVMLTLRVPFGVLGRMLKGTLLNGMKSTPGPQEEPPAAGWALAPTGGVKALANPVTVVGFVVEPAGTAKFTGSLRKLVPELPS